MSDIPTAASPAQPLDIYRFIDSVDIRKHLRALAYPFSAPEAAFLVWYCKTATLDEKIDAWHTIIDTMPDCAMDERLNMDAIPSMHAFLREFIDLQRRMLAAFLEPNQAVYLYDLIEETQQSDRFNHSESNPYSDYRRCWEALQRELDDETTYTSIQIVKRRLDPPNEIALDDACRFDSKLRLLDIDVRLEDDRDLSIACTFEGMWFEFPTPFHCGDIVCSRTAPEEPIVLEDLDIWDAETMRTEMSHQECSERRLRNKDRMLQIHRERGDISDMGMYGYAVTDPHLCVWPFLWRDDFSLGTYLNLEYYREPLTGPKRALEALSNHLKGDVPLEMLLNSYGAVLMQAALTDQLRRIKFTYVPESLGLMGLSFDETERAAAPLHEAV